MRLREKFKKLAAITLAGAMVLLSGNTLSVHAQSISEVSVSKPGYGLTTSETGSGVNVRRTPSLESGNIIVTIPYNTRLMIVGESGDFYKVQYDTAGHYGYVYSEYLMFLSRPYYLQANTNSSPLNMRGGADVNAAIVAQIPKGTYFAFGSDADGWYEGIYGNKTGYTSSSYTRLCPY